MRSEIADMFAALEGCDPTKHLVTRGRLSIVNEKQIGSPPVRILLDPEERRKRSNASETRRVQNNPKLRLKKLRRMRMYRLKKNLAAWSKSAELICFGRDLPTEAWVQIMLNPVSEDEVAAFTDFVFFLRNHRSLQRIASMLETTVEKITAALETRK